MQLEEDMERMSLLDHLDELRSRILRALAGIGVAFLICVIFTDELWSIVSQPSAAAMASLGLHEKLVFTTPMEAFSTIWVKLPLLASIFISAPWVLYQVWAFIAPGLYRNERKWAAPFVIGAAGLFVGGGLFSYFVAFRYSLTFLVGIGQSLDLQPMLTISEYFDLFINVTLGIGLVFELPALLFVLTLLHIVSPGFLWRNSRYAVVGLALVAAVISPTQDVISLALLLIPMCALYFAGVLASYGVVFYREGRSDPRKKPALWVAILSIMASVIAGIYVFRQR